MKVESSVKIAIVLKDLDIDVPYKVGSDENDGYNEKEMYSNFPSSHLDSDANKISNYEFYIIKWIVFTEMLP